MGAKVLVLGGAGFVGSNLAHFFAARGDIVTVVDGFLPRTGARRANLADLIGSITLREETIEQVADLPLLLQGCDLVADCMAWTRHRLALQDPFFDCACNVESHLHLLAQIPEACPALFVYLGSRGQYGKPRAAVIDESTAMVPEDVQGIHKTAADHHFRVFAKLKRLRVASLRFPNCFGPHQPTSGEDIGLIGSFIRDALEGKTIVVYGEESQRSVLYVGDLCTTVARLAEANVQGFAAFNLAGHTIRVQALAQTIVHLVGRGVVSVAEAPDEIRALDMGQAAFSDEALAHLLGKLPRTDLLASLQQTIQYFRGQHDLAL